MDDFLIDYLKSGKAWVLVGSGPSIEMGYPSWEKLSSFAIDLVKNEILEKELDSLFDAKKKKDYPRVFEEAMSLLGELRLIQYLQDKLKPPSSTGRIYELITRWPIPVYLTTNYDDEILKHLSSLGDAYMTDR